jgi:hypothetical protein
VEKSPLFTSRDFSSLQIAGPELLESYRANTNVYVLSGLGFPSESVRTP